MENYTKFKNNLLERHIFFEKDTFPPIGRVIRTVILLEDRNRIILDRNKKYHNLNCKK
jgi:hypothetical protein